MGVVKNSWWLATHPQRQGLGTTCEIVLPPGFIDEDSRCIRQVEAAIFRAHRNTQNLIARQTVQHVLRQAAGFRAEQKGITRPVIDLGVILRTAGGYGKQATCAERRQAFTQALVLLYRHEFMVVEPGAAQTFLFQAKAQWVHEVQMRAGVGANAYDITGIGRNLRLIQNQFKHNAPCNVTMPDNSSNLPASLATEYCGLQLDSPIVLLSGCVGFGEEYTRVAGFSNRDAGAIVLKGTTREPRLGNPPHRVYETPDGMLNAIGLQNPGMDKVVDNILPTLDFTETRFIANVCGSTVEDYAAVTKRFDDSPIDAIEVNISCPNIKEGGVSFGNDPDMSARVIEACRANTSKPLIAKLSPNQTNIQENARRCIEAGSDGLAVINTMMGMAIDVEKRQPIIGNIQGGLSGPAIKPIALLKVKQVYEVAAPHNVPIIGQGGICTARDALEFIIAGATTVGVGTALFYDPLVCRQINAGIAEYLDRHNFKNISELVGAMHVSDDELDEAASG
jgi:dihydroorotate dehydrogenase (NAD+) catalytic subunit